MNAQTPQANPQHPEPDPTWINYTQAGNQEMQLCHLESAQILYRKALGLAEQLMQERVLKFQETDVIYLYVVSCSNLANSFQVLDNQLEAETALLKAHSTTLAMMNDEKLPLAVRQTAYHGMRRTFMYLVSFYHQAHQTELLAEIMFQSRMQGQHFMTHLLKEW